MAAPAGLLDSVGMFDLAAGLPEQAEAAVARTRQVGVAFDPAAIENVVFLGMGGSGITGDVVAAVTEPLLPVPVIVAKGYECPAFVGPGSLVFAVSASGNTEETVEAATGAAEAGAHMVIVSGGGELGRLAAAWGAPLIAVPPLPMPRAALAAMAIPPLVILAQLGLYRGGEAWVSNAVEQLKRRRDQVEAAGEAGLPAELARRIGRTIPLIEGGGPVGAAAAQRWKTQINENAKSPAFWSYQPELCHNEICGWGQHGDVTRQLLTVVALRHDGEHPQVGRRFQLVGEILEEVVAGVVEVTAEGDGELAQLFDLVLLGDYTSLWMAVQAGVDPGPIPVLTELKAALAR